MDLSTVEKLRYRLNLQAQPKSPVRVIKRSRKLRSKNQAYQDTYHRLILQEKEFISANRFARELSQKAAARKTLSQTTSTVLDPVQHKFLNALHQRVFHFLNPSLTPTLPPIASHSRFPSESPVRPLRSFSPSPNPYGPVIPFISGHGYHHRNHSDKAALSSVFKNQTIRNADISRELLCHTVDVQTQQDMDDIDSCRKRDTPCRLSAT